MFSYLRTRAFSQGLIGGSRTWLTIGMVLWVIRFFQWLDRPETAVIYRDRLGLHQSVVITHLDAPPTRRQRRKATRAEKRAARKGR
jgi:hypothetical protein